MQEDNPAPPPVPLAGFMTLKVLAAGLFTQQGALLIVTLFVGGSLTGRWHDGRRYLVAISLLLLWWLQYRQLRRSAASPR